MARLSIRLEVIRQLFALSGNRCAFPGCTQNLISEKGTFIAQICHIEAANKGGQRFNEKRSEEYLRSAENLVLLCYPHHKETDEESEFTPDRLKEIKKSHEEKFKGHYTLPPSFEDKVAQSIQTQLYQIAAFSEDTNRMTYLMDSKLDEILNRTKPSEGIDELFSAQLDSIREVRKQGKTKTAIDLLLDLKNKSWTSLNHESRYRVLVNLGLAYLDLHDTKKAAAYFTELNGIDYETPDALSMICLGYAISGRFTEFDLAFPKALAADGEIINLWVAYVERHKNEKSIDEVLTEIPDAVKKSVPVLFHLGTMMIQAGRKKEGIELLKRTLSKEESWENVLDTKAAIATRIIQILIVPSQFLFHHYTAEEKEELEYARRLLTEAWEKIEGTEIATGKSFILLNRGVLNKVLGHKNEALVDFQKAYAALRDLASFKNLFFMWLQEGQVAKAEEVFNSRNFSQSLTPQEELELKLMEAKILSLKNNFTAAIGILESMLIDADENQTKELYLHIIDCCFENKQMSTAEKWCGDFIHNCPLLPMSHIVYGSYWMSVGNKENALKSFMRAEELLGDKTDISEVFQLAKAFTDLEQNEKAIPLFERLANKNILNVFSRGLIQAYFQLGDLEAALAVAENLFAHYPENPYLANMVVKIYEETRFYDKAIAAATRFLPFAKNRVKDSIRLRCALLYAQKRDWDNVKEFVSAIEHPENFPLGNRFELALLLAKLNQKEKALEIAFDARERFYDDSSAHLNYNNICLQTESEEEGHFPSVVKTNTAVTIKTDDGKEQVFLITEKKTRDATVLKPNDPFALQLLGKEKGTEISIGQSYGVPAKAVVTHIVDIYTFAFQVSTALFATRFAGKHGVAVLRATPGEPGDQFEEVVRLASIDQQKLSAEAYRWYNERKASIGVLAGIFKRNVVKQWFSLVSSQEVSIISYTHNETPAIEKAISENKPLILDLTALLTLFIVYKGAYLLSSSKNELMVTSSTIRELQEFYEELEKGAKDGLFTMSYENGRLVGHNTSAETIGQHRQVIQEIIKWCIDHCAILTPEKLLTTKREERNQRSQVLGDLFYETMLLQEENGGIVVSDDDIFKSLLRSSQPDAAFSTYQLALYRKDRNEITASQFSGFQKQLVLYNHIFIPLSAEQLWDFFDLAGFQLRKPFTVAVKGLLVMTPESAGGQTVLFFKKLYLHTGLSITREQTVLFVLNEISKRTDFAIVKRICWIVLESQFQYLPAAKDELTELINTF